MPLIYTKQDIVTMHVDAIVNPSNPQLKNFARHHGGGVCGAIFRAAGQNQMEKACKKIGKCDTGYAVITPGFALPAKHVIHTVGPIYKTGDISEAIQLYNSYTSSLWRAMECKAVTVAFPLISSGLYGYPAYESLRIAVTAIVDFLRYDNPEMDIYLCIPNDDLFQLTQTNIKDLYWEDIKDARSQWMLEFRRSSDTFYPVEKNLVYSPTTKSNP